MKREMKLNNFDKLTIFMGKQRINRYYYKKETSGIFQSFSFLKNPIAYNTNPTAITTARKSIVVRK